MTYRKIAETDKKVTLIKWTKDNQFIYWEELDITPSSVGNINQDVRINVSAFSYFLSIGAPLPTAGCMIKLLEDKHISYGSLPWDGQLGLST